MNFNAKKLVCLIACLLLVVLVAVSLADSAWKCTSCGRTGNTGNFCPNCGAARPVTSWTCSYCGKTGNTGNYCVNCGKAKGTVVSNTVYGLATSNLAVNSGPGTKRYFDELGTYNVKGQYVEILAKCWDPNNDIWWVEVRIPNTSITGWTGYKRFDKNSFDLNAVPTESWY